MIKTSIICKILKSFENRFARGLRHFRIYIAPEMNQCVGAWRMVFSSRLRYPNFRFFSFFHKFTSKMQRKLIESAIFGRIRLKFGQKGGFSVHGSRKRRSRSWKRGRKKRETRIRREKKYKEGSAPSWRQRDKNVVRATRARSLGHYNHGACLHASPDALVREQEWLERWKTRFHLRFPVSKLLRGVGKFWWAWWGAGHDFGTHRTLWDWPWRRDIEIRRKKGPRKKRK